MSCAIDKCWCKMDHVILRGRVIHLKPGHAKDFTLRQWFEGGPICGIDRLNDVIHIANKEHEAALLGVRSDSPAFIEYWSAREKETR